MKYFCGNYKWVFNCNYNSDITLKGDKILTTSSKMAQSIGVSSKLVVGHIVELRQSNTEAKIFLLACICSSIVSVDIQLALLSISNGFSSS